MDSGLARGFAPWTPGGYIPVANMLFIPVPNIVYLSSQHIVYPSSQYIVYPSQQYVVYPSQQLIIIPVSYLFFISVSHIFFYISACIYHLAVLPALIDYNSITTHLKSEPIISLLYKPSTLIILTVSQPSPEVNIYIPSQ